MKHYCIVKTDIGFIGLAEEDGILLRSTLPKPTNQEAYDAIGEGLTGSGVEDNSGFGDLPGRLKRYASGEVVDFSDIPVDISMFGRFHQEALCACQKIPYGQIVTYGDLARIAGVPRAARAVGSAMAGNNTPIIVPCHRVLAAGGKIGGFSSGLEWKRVLLKIEGVDV